ncbi:hypothetical protein HD554DRAFT_2166914 [Boletus coccyginus]|nr:hypothetical protein HD554DRAFT_2166914 [Boletus coccyginus]
MLYDTLSLLLGSHSNCGRTTPSPSDNSSPTSPLGSKTTCTQSTFDQVQSEEEFDNVHITDLVDRATLPNETTRRTPDVDAGDNILFNTNLSIKQASTVNADHCRAVIQALQVPFFDIQTFRDVTPAEFDLIESVFSEGGKHQSFKLYYIPDLSQIFAMTPRPIHEAPIVFLSECSRALLVPHRLDRITPLFLFNSPIESDNNSVTPDFRLDLELSYRPLEFPVPVWIVECGFSQTRIGMERKLAAAVAISPEIDAAFMISIRKSSLKLPESDHPLFSLPKLQRTAFTPDTLPHDNKLTPIVVEGVTWIDIKSVNISVFLRGEDGEFNFSEGNALSARGSLVPLMTMQPVTHMLNLASRRLLVRIADTMQENQDDDDRIAHLRAASETVTFPADWSCLLQKIQASLYYTAWSHYLGCLRRKVEQNAKRKLDLPLEPGPSDKRHTLSVRDGRRNKPKPRARKSKHRK